MINYLEKFFLKGKTAFITGGAGLIGSEVSKALASAGAQVIILDIDLKKSQTLVREIQRAGHNASYEFFDMTRMKIFERKIELLVRKYHGADIWVNMAYPRTKDWSDPIEEVTLSNLRNNVDIQTNSYAWSSRIIALNMKKRKTKGVIINCGSIYGVVANDFTIYEGTKMTGPMAYSLIKGGIVHFTRYMASYFGRFGIRFNSVCPGAIVYQEDQINPIFLKNYKKRVPLNRLCRAEDIACGTLFLASDAAAYVTGHTLMVDGGWTII